ncbi:MAG: hypothetical protein HKN13_13045 [Rhodothermales bacterium]|nr:hypothetical protein [Rhodothermales bacterium]
MIDDKVFELINAGVDDELSPSQRSELDQLIADQPEVADLFSQMTDTVHRVQALKSTDPPADLRDRIMASLPAVSMAEHRETRLDSVSSGVGSFVELVRSLFQPRYALQFATVFAGGLLIGALVVSGLTGIGPFGELVDPNQAVGTIGGSPENALTGPTSTTELRGDLFNGTVTVSRSAGGLDLVVEGQTNQTAVIMIGFDEMTEFEGLSYLENKQSANATISSGLITATLSDSNALKVRFRTSNGEPSRFVVQLKEGDSITVTEEITI